MAGIKFEKGFFAIPNDLFDAIAQAGFTVAERAVIDCIMRYTYGFNRRECQAALSFIAGYTGMNKRNLKAAMKSLIEKNVILVVENYTTSSARTVRINPDPEGWGSELYQGGAQNCTTLGSESVPDRGSELYQGWYNPRPPKNNNIEITERNNRERGQSPSSPSLQEVADFCREMGYRVSPERFWNFYQGTGWKLSKGKPIVDWRPVLSNWESMEWEKEPEEQEIETDCYGRPIPPKYEG